MGITATTTVPVANDQRKAILQGAISRYVTQGYRVISQTDTTAQLLKPRKPINILLLVILWFAVLGGVLYLLMRKGDQGLYLEVDAYGNLIERKS